MNGVAAPLWHRALRSAGTASAALFLLLAPPTALVVFIGWPLPRATPNWETVRDVLTRPTTDQLLVNGLACLLWVLWILFALALLIEIVATVRGKAAPHLPGLSPLQTLSAGLVGAATLALVPVGSRPISSPGQLSPNADAALMTVTAHAAIRQLPGDSNRVSERQVAHLQQSRTVRFSFDSAELSAAAKTTIAQIATDIRHRANPSHPVTLVGHTDSVGPAEYNQRLSVRRAETVRRELLSHALDGHYHFQVSGKGETSPIAEETHPDGRDDPAGRARNRRVDIAYKPRRPTGPPPAHPTTPPRQRPQPPTSEPSASPRSIPSGQNNGTEAPSPPSTPSQPSTPHPAPSSPGGREPAPIMVRLPTGALVGLGLAAAISIAVAATRLHRRHRRKPAPDRLTVAEPEPTSPPAIRTLRKAHLDAFTAAGKPPPSDVQLVSSDLYTEAPTHLTIGVRDNKPVTVPISGLSAGIDGPAAADAVRAVATELLARAHRSRAEVLLSKHTATTLFNLTGNDLEQLNNTVPGLITTPDLDAALRHLESEILHRARLMSDHDVPDVASLRAADPAEPLPTIILFTTADESERFTRTLNAALQLAERHGIGGLLLGPWPMGTTCHVDTDGQVLHADGPHADTWSNAQLFRLTSADAADLLQTVRTAHGAKEPSPTQPPENSTAQEAQDQRPDQAPAALRAPQRKDEQVPPPVHVRIFGPITVETTNGKVTTGLRRVSRDLIAFLALHPDGVTRERAIDAIWQDRDLTSGSTMFHTAINNTRQTLRKTTGLREPMFITHAAGRYHLDEHLIDVDLWQFLRALDTASNATTDPDRLAALRSLAEVYTGELADDLTYEWAELERERIRRTAIDALVRLAHALQADNPDDARTALEQAFDHDPTSEPLACDLMRLQARLGEFDAVRRTHRLLVHQLNELDIDPSPETDQLLTALLRQRRHPSSTVGSAD